MEEKSLSKNKFSLGIHIIISGNPQSSSRFNKNKILEEYKFLIDNNIYLFLKGDHRTLIKNKNLLFEKGDNLIFSIKFKKQIELLNYIDKCFKCDLLKFYNKIYQLNFKLWKSITKIKDEDKFEEIKNKNIYIHELKENDIIRLGDVKLILREFHLRDKDDNKKQKLNIFIPKVKNEKDKICGICNKKYLDENDPIIDLCIHGKGENYKHFSCLKEKLKNDNLYKNENNGSFTYQIQTQCDFCPKFIPLSFCIENKETIFNLIDIPKNQNEDYLFFESFDFQDTGNYYIKYFFYIKLGNIEKNKNIENIIIGKNNEGKYKYDKLIKIEKYETISDQHALIEYDKETKKLILKNLSEYQNTLILQDKFIINPNNNDNNNVIFELGNIKINVELLNNENLNEIKKEWSLNEDQIEIAKNEPDY